jgi:hypothetical protein
MTPPKKIVGTIDSPETKRLLLSFPSLKTGGHGLPDDVKAQAYAFLDRWIKQA